MQEKKKSKYWWRRRWKKSDEGQKLCEFVENTFLCISLWLRKTKEKNHARQMSLDTFNCGFIDTSKTNSLRSPIHFKWPERRAAENTYKLELGGYIYFFTVDSQR